MMKLWSYIVLIYAVCGLVVPAPVPALNPFPFGSLLNIPGLLPSTPNYISYARSPYANVPGSLASYLPINPLNPFYPGQIAMGGQGLNPANPTNTQRSGLTGGANMFAQGLMNVGLALASVFSSAVGGVTGLAGNLVSGILGDGQVGDSTLSHNNQQPFLPPIYIPDLNQTSPAVPGAPAPALAPAPAPTPQPRPQPGQQPLPQAPLPVTNPLGSTDTA